MTQSIIEKAKQAIQINKEGCTVDFTDILLINEKYEIKDVVNFPSRLNYIKNKRALLLRIVKNNVSVSDPLTPQFVKTFSSRILVKTEGYSISKASPLSSLGFNNFVVTGQNDWLPVGTRIHNPVAKSKEGITCYDTDGKPLLLPLEYVTVIIPNKVKKNKSKGKKEPVVIEEQLPVPFKNEQEVLVLEKPVKKSHVTVSTNVNCIFNGYKILSTETLNTVKKDSFIKEGVFADLNGDVHQTLEDALKSNEKIIANTIEENIKQLVLDSL